MKRNKITISFKTKQEREELEKFKRLVRDNGGTMEDAGRALVKRANRERVLW